MKKILVLSQKGGSGKTTLVAHLAVEAERTGDGPAWVIDTDKQGTLSLWHERREADTPERADVSFARMGAGLMALAQRDGAYCFIDTAPTVSEQNMALIDLVDMVLIPVRPSPADLWSVSETIAQVKEAEKPFLFVITQAKPHASITAQTIAALSRHGHVAQTFIADRVAYAMAMTGGKTAPELGSKTPAAEEISGLWQELKSCFHENMQLIRSVAND